MARAPRVTPGGAGPAQRKGRRPPPANETARERFLRIGEPRVTRVIKDVQLLANLARGNYEWQFRDVQLIREAVMTELDRTLATFNIAKPDRNVQFHFDTEELEQRLRDTIGGGRR